MPSTDVIPEDAKNLIKSLLVMNPEERLGAGPEGSSNSFVALRNHPFIKDFDFKQLHMQKAPIVCNTIKCSIMTKSHSTTDVTVKPTKAKNHT
jgi:hypothetical protein